MANGDLQQDSSGLPGDQESSSAGKGSLLEDHDPSSNVYHKMIQLLDEMDEENFRKKVREAIEVVDRRKSSRGKKWIPIMGLVLSILGTAVIWIDSQAVARELFDMVFLITEPAGVWRDISVEPSQIDEFHYRIESASSLDKKGFILLILGFVMQVFGVVRMEVQNPS